MQNERLQTGNWGRPLTGFAFLILHFAFFLAAGLVDLTGSAMAPAEDKPPENKDQPKVLLAAPLGLPLGATTKLTLRGLKLDTASEVRLLLPGAAAPDQAAIKQLAAGKAEVPAGQEAARIGDTQVELEITLPAELPEGPLAVAVKTSGGESSPHELLLYRGPLFVEEEPNDGFREARPVVAPRAIDGAIRQAQDVDVFRYEASPGEKLIVEVLAARHGSPLDSIVTLYAADGRELTANDDFDASGDSRLEVTLPKAGVYYISLQDAHDQGGPAHVYRLLLRVQK
jgi:hypothetical protein